HLSQGRRRVARRTADLGLGGPLVSGGIGIRFVGPTARRRRNGRRRSRRSSYPLTWAVGRRGRFRRHFGDERWGRSRRRARWGCVGGGGAPHRLRRAGRFGHSLRCVRLRTGSAFSFSTTGEPEEGNPARNIVVGFPTGIALQVLRAIRIPAKAPVGVLKGLG